MTKRTSMKRTCEVCGHSKLRKSGGHGCIHLQCPKCESRSNHYYSKNGAAFGYPKVWGRLVAVIEAPEFEEAYDEQGQPIPVDELIPFPTSWYYIFVAEDGTIRRARYYEIPEVLSPAPHLPKGMAYYSRWDVDVVESVTPASESTPTTKRRQG